MAATRAIALGLLLLVTPARADDRATAALFVHTDDDGLVVVHPAASVEVEPTEGLSIGATYDADVITAATVDVRTSASARGFEETRHGASASITEQLSRTVRLGGGYALSISPDHTSHTASASLVVEDAERDHTVTIALATSREAVGTVHDPVAAGHVTAAGASIGWATLLSPRAVLEVTLAGQLRHGYLESPYRFVTIEESARQSAVSVPEEVPDLRLQGAAQVRLRVALAPRIFLRASWRLHGDDWGIAGHTVAARLTADLGRQWLLHADGRVYVQRSASFYHGAYRAAEGVPELRTRDRELAAVLSFAGGLRVEGTLPLTPGLDLGLDAGGELARQRYFDTPLLPRRLAATTGASIALRW